MADELKVDWALDRHVEVRYDNRNEVDEVVTRDAGMVHIERMNDTCYWMAIYHPDEGNDSRVVLYFNVVDGKIQISLEVE